MPNNVNLRKILQVLKKDPGVLYFRVKQYGLLRLLRKIGYWERLETRVGEFWQKNSAQWLKLARDDQLLIGEDQKNAFIGWAKCNPDWVARTISKAGDISSGRFNIFDQPYEFDINNLPWHTDWRYAYTWVPAPYETYHFSITDKPTPYDVKYPWELSRFAFLFPLAQTFILTGDFKWQELIGKLTQDWEIENPVSRSVNWQAMICSIHGISLSLAVQILATDEKTKPEIITLMLRQLTLQAEFIYKNLEFSTARGNHYASNLAGLLIIGATIQKVYKPATRWVKYAVDRISSEIEFQYFADGVHFEKSTSYHRLVTEFFVLCLWAMERLGYRVSEKAYKRLLKACHYTRGYTRPDGLAANFGDNDGAWLLAFDHQALRDHRSLLALASVYFNEPVFKLSAQHPSATIPWLLGQEGVQKWEELSPSSESNPESTHFEEGGMVVVRANNHFFIADFGEVGKRGLGGHGHNDTFSFELCLDGVPLIVDSGSPVYTGDLRKMSAYSRTDHHNTIMVDSQEMARLLGVWRISDEATPRNVQFRSYENFDTIEGEHLGYTRLSDPLIHKRCFSFYKYQGRLECKDILICKDKHQVRIFLHIAPGLNVKLTKEMLVVTLTDTSDAIISWKAGATAWIESAQISETFGQVKEGTKLILSYDIQGATELFFEIKLQQKKKDLL